MHTSGIVSAWIPIRLAASGQRRDPGGAGALIGRSSSETRAALVLSSLMLLLAALAVPAWAGTWNFTDVTLDAGIDFTHGYVEGGTTVARVMANGAAAGDYDNDGWIDLYVVHGDIGPNLLYHNLGNGTFEEVAVAAGVDVTGELGCGPHFADLDGDGWLDLLLGGVEESDPQVFHNLGDGTFQDITVASGLVTTRNTWSFTLADYDGDLDLDLFMTHWGAPQFSGEHLWRNNGTGAFVEADSSAGMGAYGGDLSIWSFTFNLADINSDGWPDILLASDYGNSEVYINNGDATFTETTDPQVMTDANGMGAAVGDYDNDGDLDWFVTSVSEPDTGGPGINTGNRLYQNDGTGTFIDATDAAGVRTGYWGWGSTFNDFNNDGYLDLYEENGWAAPWNNLPPRMFVSNGDATFTENSASLGLDHTAQGRGVNCLDFDRDGDIDIFVTRKNSSPILYRNDGGNDLNWLMIKLNGTAPNTEAIGTRIYATTSAGTQMREMHSGNNYVSNDPAEIHFGLGAETVVSELRIIWPGGAADTLYNIPANNFIILNQGAITTVQPGLEGTPGAVQLLGASPNPFSTETAISFQIRDAAAVRLGIYDVSGRLVRTLIDERLPAGSQRVRWNGRDAGKNRVADGVYVYRLESEGAVRNGRVILVR